MGSTNQSRSARDGSSSTEAEAGGLSAMLVAKVWYFFYFGGMVCILPFVNLIYRANGLSDAQIGIIAALKPWVSAPASFAWSGLSDRFSLHKAVLLATFITSTLVRSSLLAFSSFGAFLAVAVVGEALAAPCGVLADSYVVAACERDTDYGKARLWGAVAWGGLSAVAGWLVSSAGMPAGFACYLVLSVPCVACASQMDFSKLGQQRQQQQQHEDKPPAAKSGSSKLGSLELACCQQPSLQQPSQQSSQQPELQQPSQQPEELQLAECDDDVEARQHLLSDQAPAAAAATQSGDATALQQQQQQQPQQQPQHAVPAVACQQQQRQLVQKSSDAPGRSASKHQQNSSRGAADVTLVVDAGDSQRLLPGAGSSESLEPSQQQQRVEGQPLEQPRRQFWQQMRQLLTVPILIFFWQAIIMGFGIGVIGEYLFLFLAELGGSETLMGLTLTVTCLAEVPVFHFQGALLRLISTQTTLHIVLAAYVLRLALYALLPLLASPWAVLPIELLHGVCFGLGWGVGTVASKRLAPEGLASTTQGIFQGLYFGVGQGCGALIGGIAKQRHGSQRMFLLCSSLCLAGWMLSVVAEKLVACRSRRAAAAAAGQAAGSDRRRWRHPKYLGLESKDSGPDLSVIN